MTENIAWEVEGMTCTNCANSVKKFLERQGAGQVDVNFMTKEVHFTTVPSADLPTLKNGIHQLGYKVLTPVGTDVTESENHEGHHHAHGHTHASEGNGMSLRIKLILTAVLTLPLVFNHLAHAFGWHIGWLSNAWVQFALTLPVYIIGLFHYGRSSWQALRSGYAHMDLLILIGSTAAFVYSLVGLVQNNPNYLFFETAATIITLVLFGNWMEDRAVAQTTTAIGELTRLQVEKANRLLPSGQTEVVDTKQVQLNDKLIVQEGEKIPTDGIIVEGAVDVDESMITGESMPVSRRAGEPVIGASIVHSGNMTMQVTAIGKASTLGQMVALVKQAQQQKPKIQRLADKAGSVFVPTVLGISLLVLVGSIFIFDIPFHQAIMNSIAVLVISCPCAMGLATPAAVMVGVGHMAKRGILVKGGETLERLAGLRYLLLDKTGTLTTGNFQVQESVYKEGSEAEVDGILYAMEQKSAHPIAKSMLRYVQSKYPNLPAIPSLRVQEHRGTGIIAHDATGNTYVLQSARNSLFASSVPVDAIVLEKNMSQLVAYFRLADTLKPNTESFIRSLKNIGVSPILVSGDQQNKVEETANKLGIALWFAEQKPAQKMKILAEYQQKAPTGMVGDGINDAPALAQADLGISMGNATATAIQSAQVVLLSDKMESLENAFRIGRKTVQTIRQNLFWAFAYNVLAIPLAAMGYLSPMWGALFMAMSDMIIIGNSLRLRLTKFK